MSSDVAIYCDGQWPGKPMYSTNCTGPFKREKGALWVSTKYARGMAKVAGWKVIAGRDMCPECQKLLKR